MALFDLNRRQKKYIETLNSDNLGVKINEKKQEIEKIKQEIDFIKDESRK